MTDLIFATQKELDALVEMSNKYGADADYVLAGGGNTSFKTGDVLYVKGSGTSLATIKSEGFVKISRAELEKIWQMTFSDIEAEREAQVLEAMMDSRLKGEEKKRPSVETLLHDLLEQKYILHVHPSLVNGVTCARDGEETVKKLFPEAIWVESTKPGYILAAACKKKVDEYKAQHGRAPQVIFLQNHGIFFAADSTDEIDAIVERTMSAIKAQVKIFPCKDEVDHDEALAEKLAPQIRMMYSPDGEAVVKYTANHDIIAYSMTEKSFEPIKGSFSPDHIVYCKASPLYVENKGDDTMDELEKKFNEYKAENGYAPKIIFVSGVGMFACGATKKEADTATEVFEDAIKIADYSASFGGYLPLDDEMTNFIKNWEVESYRAKVALSSAPKKRLAGKISIVTGSAQGFGAGIAEDMVKEGAYVVIADMNLPGAQAMAQSLCEKYGKGAAYPVFVNVTDEESVKNMIRQTVLEYGGIDILVNNAGIVRTGSLEEMTKQNFELVTSIDYTAFFVCTKYSVVPMKIQRKYSPDYMADVIGINSKSGLEGSNKNFAYAGAKFGGIGLTQSFALELAPYGIKVNSICPGNFLDGPLWSDPVKGLFVQYLNAGKVPGAKTVADVRKYYESKVPLGRGCVPADISKALMYIVEQKYETGQAVPVTGGQTMLN
ncbi:MAG: SDR family NAD(P)-dependent oxidoreductase [Clostridia bacterium]|nr:SDR family NAD(P)-dependent oxidoreductase [Clostridia bacterium]